MRLTQSDKKLLFKWLGVGLALLIAASVSTFYSDLYGYDYDVPDMPLLSLTLWLVGLGLGFLYLPILITSTLNNLSRLPPQNEKNHQTRLQLILVFILAIGLLARLILFWSAPAMEDDYQRYLWDGAVTAHGYNPYAINPSKVFHGQTKDPQLKKLAQNSGNTLRRVNHKNLRTIYPPMAQGAFSLAYLIKPWSLNAWRFVVLLSEIGAIGFMLALLSILGRSPLWIGLYWWNPLIIKELINSAHMDVLLLPFIMGALYFTLQKKYKTSTSFIFMATTIKLWPILLLPILLRPLWPDWRKILLYLSVFSLALLVILSPIVIAGLDQSSGFVAYVKGWQTNSAFFPAFKMLWQIVLSPFHLTEQTVGLLSRLLIAIAIGLTALKLSWSPISSPHNLIAKCFFLTAALFLVSPAQFPWYALWVLPFSVFIPVTGILWLTALLPLYYLGFHLMVIQKHYLFANIVVWVIWIPIWASLLWQFKKRKPSTLNSLLTGTKS